MEPVRVRLYGIFWVTKRRYILQLILAAVLLAVLVTVSVRWQEVRPRVIQAEMPWLNVTVPFLDASPWIILAVTGLQVLEAFYVFRAFARKEREGPTAPPAPKETPTPAENSPPG